MRVCWNVVKQCPYLNNEILYPKERIGVHRIVSLLWIQPTRKGCVAVYNIPPFSCGNPPQIFPVAPSYINHQLLVNCFKPWIKLKYCSPNDKKINLNNSLWNKCVCSLISNVTQKHFRLIDIQIDCRSMFSYVNLSFPSRRVTSRDICSCTYVLLLCFCYYLSESQWLFISIRNIPLFNILLWSGYSVMWLTW